MELGSRKHDDAAWRRQQPHVRLQFDGFECLWLRTRVDTDLLGGMEAAVAVPLLVVVAVRAVAQSVGEITRVKSHAIGRVDGKYRQPPVDLAHRRRVPGVAMRVKRVSDTGAQVIIAGRGSQARHVEIGLQRVASQSLKNSRQQALALGMMDKAGFQRGEQLRKLVHRHLVLGQLRIELPKGLREHLMCEPGKRQRLCGRRIHEQVAPVDVLTPLVIAQARVVVDVYHAVLRWRAATSSGSSLRGILPPTYSPPPRHAAASSPGTCLCRTTTSSVATDSWPAGDESLP